MVSLLCKVMGAIFIVVAIWGFIDGDNVLIFHVNTAHNVVHLLSGIGALACGFAGERPSRIFALTIGAVYGLVAILGFARVPFIVDLLHINMPDNWLHLLIAAVFLGGALFRGVPGRAGTAPPPRPA